RHRRRRHHARDLRPRRCRSRRCGGDVALGRIGRWGRNRVGPELGYGEGRRARRRGRNAAIWNHAGRFGTPRRGRDPPGLRRGRCGHGGAGAGVGVPPAGRAGRGGPAGPAAAGTTGGGAAWIREAGGAAGTEGAASPFTRRSTSPTIPPAESAGGSTSSTPAAV